MRALVIKGLIFISQDIIDTKQEFTLATQYTKIENKGGVYYVENYPSANGKFYIYDETLMTRVRKPKPVGVVVFKNGKKNYKKNAISWTFKEATELYHKAYMDRKVRPNETHKHYLDRIMAMEIPYRLQHIKQFKRNTLKINVYNSLIL